MPALVLGGTTLYLIDLAHRRDVSNFELRTLDQKIQEFEKFFADTLGLLELQVESLELVPAQDTASPWQESLLDALLGENQAFEEVSFVSLEGKEVVKKSRHNTEPFLLHVAELPKFKEARAGRNFVSDIYFTLSGPMVTIAAPVKINNTVAQVLSAQVNLSSLVRSLAATQLGTTGYILLFDRKGILVSTPSHEIVPSGFDASHWDRVARILQGETLTGLDEHDRYVSPFGSGAVVGAGKSIPQLGWALLAEWPLEDADAVIRHVRNQVIAVTMASILAVFLFAPLFASRLVKPIRILEAGAADIEKGNFEKQVEIKTNDELEELGQAFNKMAKGLKRLEELREEFVFIAAHELRTPVTAIKGYVSMILEGDAGRLSEQMKKFLDRVQQSNQRLLQLVEDLLEVARSEAGRIVIKVHALDIQEPIRATLEELKPLATEKSIAINYEPPATLPQVLADESRVREVMVNLVGNAIKYTPVNGHVWISHNFKEKEMVTRVRDDGFGISKEAQKKLFEKFYRVQTQETRDITGTGLGLFITKEIVEKMGGKIWVESDEKKGSAFNFSLPLADEKQTTQS